MKRSQLYFLCISNTYHHLLLVVLISLAVASCSLSIDVSPNSLNQLKPVEMSAGEMSAGEMSAGEMSAGEMSAGEMSAGEMSAGGQTDRFTGDKIPTTLNQLVSEQLPPFPVEMYGDLPPFAGQFGIDDEAGDEAGDQGGGSSPIESLIQALLPYPDCVMYDLINERCLQHLPRSREDTCQDWLAHYQMTRILPWTGDRSSCELGEYHPAGYDDLKTLLNLYRRQLGLNEVIVESSSTLSECALAHDIAQRDGQGVFNADSECFSEIRAQAYMISNKLSLTGQWSLYSALHAAVGQTNFNQALSSTLTIRQRLLSPKLTKLNAGGRGIANCLQVEEGSLPPNTLPIVAFPPVGENPLAIIHDGNYNGRVPWSLAITTGLAAGLSIELFEYSPMGERTSRPIDLGLSGLSIGGILHYAFSPQSQPEVDTLYELEIQWTSADEQAHHYRLFIIFADCALTQPVHCDPAPDNCVLLGSHCGAVNSAGNLEWSCIWDGPGERGESCDQLGSEGCASGVCASFSQGPEVCSAVCDLEDPSAIEASCDLICPEGFSDQGTYGLCP